MTYVWELKLTSITVCAYIASLIQIAYFLIWFELVSLKLHGLQILIDKTNFGLLIYNHANFYWCDKPSIYWSVKGISVFSAFHWPTSDTPLALQCITIQ